MSCGSGLNCCWGRKRQREFFDAWMCVAIQSCTGGCAACNYAGDYATGLYVKACGRCRAFGARSGFTAGSL
jgi:hypothetical protein